MIKINIYRKKMTMHYKNPLLINSYFTSPNIFKYYTIFYFYLFSCFFHQFFKSIRTLCRFIKIILKRKYANNCCNYWNPWLRA
jgi:hypothetical protein